MFNLIAYHKFSNVVPQATHIVTAARAQIQNVKGPRCWVTGVIADLSGKTLASCEVMATDIRGVARSWAETS